MKSSKGEILYIQFTNPGGYPPLEHSSDIFLDRGFKTTFLGIQSRGQSRSLRFQERDGRVVRLLPWVDPGIRQKLQFARYFIWASVFAVIRRPRLVYCSDHLSTPVALVLSLLGRSVVYHEHDAPGHPRSVFERVIARTRRAILRRVPVIVPSDGRRELVEVDGAQTVAVVWNCPAKKDLDLDEELPDRSDRQSLRLVYQGSIVPERLPVSVIEAMAHPDLRGRAKLRIIGYATPSGAQHVNELLATAERLGIGGCVEYLGPVPTRREMLRLGAECDLGLSLMPMSGGDRNMQTMAGASNKPFDYLAQGLLLLCSDLGQWRQLFKGFAMFCDPSSSDSVSDILREFADMDEGKRLGLVEEARRKVSLDWNYEARFIAAALPLMELE